MLKKIVIAGSAAAIVLGAGTAAMAASGSSSPSTAPSGSSTSKPATGEHGKQNHGKRDQLRRALHATWVTRGAKGSTGYVTHDAIRGSVTAVSATSITVKAVDNVSQTYAVNSSTKVHTRADGKGKAGTVSEVKSGDKVMVLGTGTSSLTATQILDGTKK